MIRFLKVSTIILIPFLALFSGCKVHTESTESVQHSRIPADTASAKFGQLITYSELNATSAFQLKAEIKAPVTGYIEKVLVSQGDIVPVNKILFKVRTKEAMALKSGSLDSLKLNGTVDVKSATNGIVAALQHSPGDYVAEGDPLCQLAIPESFIFILEVPFELSHLIKPMAKCNIVLPDSQVIKGVIRSELPAITGNSQTVKFVVKSDLKTTYPENLTVKVRVIKETVNNAVSLPKYAILTNETMNDFWVMKVINDTMAVKVSVKTGIVSGDQVQIIEPVFKPSDVFLTSGNYGLGDTAYRKILKSTVNGQ
jgi:hypothetical protein